MYKDKVESEMPLSDLHNRVYIESHRFNGFIHFRVISEKIINEDYFIRNGKILYDYNADKNISRWVETIRVFSTLGSILLKLDSGFVRVDDKPDEYELVVDNTKYTIRVKSMRKIRLSHILVSQSESNPKGYNLPQIMSGMKNTLREEMQKYIDKREEDFYYECAIQ